MEGEMIFQIVFAFLSSIGAYFAFRAKKEAGEANKAVNHTDKNQPRLYDIALSNYEGLARIKERQKGMEKTIEKLSEVQDAHSRQLNDHQIQLAKHGESLERAWQKELSKEG